MKWLWTLHYNPPHIDHTTKPRNRSPVSVFMATRLFSSNLNEKMAQRFYYLILLGRVRRDIDENGRLNYHLYNALKKAVYKPAAFYKVCLQC